MILYSLKHQSLCGRRCLLVFQAFNNRCDLNHFQSMGRKFKVHQEFSSLKFLLAANTALSQVTRIRCGTGAMTTGAPQPLLTRCSLCAHGCSSPGCLFLLSDAEEHIWLRTSMTRSKNENVDASLLFYFIKNKLGKHFFYLPVALSFVCLFYHTLCFNPPNFFPLISIYPFP